MSTSIAVRTPAIANAAVNPAAEGLSTGFRCRDIAFSELFDHRAMATRV
jgi:hypothetical protein